MDLREELKSGGAYPSGPVSAWPRERAAKLSKAFNMKHPNQNSVEVVKASPMDMAKGLVRTAGQAIKSGRVSAEIRDERYSTCKACPAFLPHSKRCSECGCFMETKTWIGGNKDKLCPLKKWDR